MDFGNIFYKTDTKAYIIRNGTYTVPSPEDTTVPESIHKEFDNLYREIDQYAKEHPEFVTKLNPPTEKEILAAQEASVRAYRDSLLAQTDYLIMPDYPISQEALSKVKEYRQALRDVPEQEGFPQKVVWPEYPVLTKM